MPMPTSPMEQPALEYNRYSPAAYNVSGVREVNLTVVLEGMRLTFNTYTQFATWFPGGEIAGDELGNVWYAIDSLVVPMGDHLFQDALGVLTVEANVDLLTRYARLDG